MGSNNKLSVWINAEVFTYSEEFNFLVKERYQSKRNLDFPNSKMQNWKGNEFGDMFSLVLSDALWRISFSFVDRWEIELVKCSLHIPLLNLSQSLITYWQSIGATIEDFAPKFGKSLSHQEFQPHPVHPNYENNTWSNKNT